MPEITVRSDLNAVVFRIEAAAGQSVGEGDALMLLEAMKMEIPVLAPVAGTLTLLVKERDEVSEGQPLARLQF